MGTQSEEVKEQYIQELADRILRTGSEETAWAIRDLPNGAAAVIYPQLEQIIEDEVLRLKAYAAITRLADGGRKAVPKYIAVLKDYHRALNEVDYNLRSTKIKNIMKAPIGAMVGLCRLGVEALPAKEVLFSLINEDQPGWTPSVLAVNALLAMGAYEELKQNYEGNERVWQRIQKSIRDKERAEEKNRQFCGKY